MDVFEDALDLGPGENDGQTFILAGAQGVDAGQFDVQHLVIEEEDGLHGYVLGAGRDVTFDSEVREEGFDLGGAQVTGMGNDAVGPLVEEDEAGHPVDVGLFGAVRVMFDAHDVARLIEQFGFSHRRAPPGSEEQYDDEMLSIP